MARRRQKYSSHPRYRYREPVRYQRESCLERLLRFLVTVGIIILIVLLLSFAVTHLPQTTQFFLTIFVAIGFLISIFPRLLFYGGILLAIFTSLLVIYGLVRLIGAISKQLSVASAARSEAALRKAKATQEKARIEQLKTQNKREQVRLAQETYLSDERRRRGSMQQPEKRVYATRKLTQELEQSQEEKPVIPGMPEIGTCYYRDYGRGVQPGQLLVGIQKNRKPRIGTWADFKIVLDLGGSASGKTTTIAQQCLAIVRGNGMLALCDPHAHKPDSLLRKVYPLRYAAFPGTVLAVEHSDILRNIQVVKQELDNRVQGGDCSIPLCLVIEEMNRLQRDKAISNALTEILQIIGQEGRGYNVYAIIGAQQISHFAGIRKSIISFVIHRVDESEAQLCIPARYAKYASELAPGQTFVKDADGMTEALIQTLITAQDIEQEGARLAQRSPRRQTQAFYAQDTEHLNRPGPPRRQPVQPAHSAHEEEPSLERRDYGRGTRALHKNRLQPAAQQRAAAEDQQEETILVNEESLPPARTTRTTENLDHSRLATWEDTGPSQAISPPSRPQFKKPTIPRLPAVSPDVVKQNQSDLGVNKLSQLEQLRKKQRKS
jgi:hypothetical protein